jgi:hypothetical protein
LFGCLFFFFGGVYFSRVFTITDFLIVILSDSAREPMVLPWLLKQAHTSATPQNIPNLTENAKLPCPDAAPMRLI